MTRDTQGLTSSPDSDLEKTRKKFETQDGPDSQKPKKERKKRKKKSDPKFTKEGTLALLRLPFQLAGGVTGFTFDPIAPEIQEPLSESALQVIKEFGFEVASKYINLAVFIALYGTCSFTWFNGYKQYKSIMTEKKKDNVIADKKSNSTTE